MSGGTVAVVQARMTSTRLPGKVLMPVLGRPLLHYQLERMRRARRLDRIVIATTLNGTDDPIAAFCTDSACDFTRGPEQDVLRRYADAARRFDASRVVRLTADCPLVDPELIDLAIDRFDAATGGCDYLSNMLQPSYPYGMAVEVMTSAALLEAAAQARDAEEREHVTPFIWRRPGRYRLHSLVMTPDLSGQRWTVDTPEDFELVSRILAELYPRQPEFGMKDVLALLERHPEWAKINAHVQQKAVASGEPAPQ